MTFPVKQRSYVVLEVVHTKDMPELANMIAGRAWTISGVEGVEVVKPGSADDLRCRGFSEAEIALGSTEVHRS